MRPIISRKGRADRLPGPWGLWTIAAVVIAGAGPVRGGAIAVSVGGLKAFPTSNARFTGGQGGVAANANLDVAGGAPAVQDPKAGAGAPFDDTDKAAIPDTTGRKATAVTRANVEKLGKAFSQVYGNPNNLTSLALGRNLEYNVKTTPDKIADARANKPPLTATAGQLKVGNNTAQSTATFSTVLNADGKTGTVSGSANAEVDKDPKKPTVGFAAAIVHDPVTFVQDSLGSPASVQVSIGAGFLLKADQPGDFAGAFFDLETDRDGALFTFGVQIDDTTQALTASNFVVDTQTGFASSDDFISRFLLPAFTLSDNTLTLSNPGDLTLATVSLDDSSGAPLTVTWTYGGYAGTAVPEPSGLLLCASGLAGLALTVGIRRSRGACRGPGGDEGGAPGSARPAGLTTTPRRGPGGTAA